MKTVSLEEFKELCICVLLLSAAVTIYSGRVAINHCFVCTLGDSCQKLTDVLFVHTWTQGKHLPIDHLKIVIVCCAANLSSKTFFTVIPIIEKDFSVVFVITLLLQQFSISTDLLGYLVMSGIDRIMGQSPAREVFLHYSTTISTLR